MKFYTFIVISLLLLCASQAQASNKEVIERGKYIVTIGGCNDCHTDGYAQAGGKIPEADWLMGSSVGFKGPWGVTYPANLRLVFNEMEENQWVKGAHNFETSPPMPWFNIRDISKADLRAVYHYIKRLGVKGSHAPDYVPPTEQAKTPFILFVPQNVQTEMNN